MNFPSLNFPSLSLRVWVFRLWAFGCEFPKFEFFRFEISDVNFPDLNSCRPVLYRTVQVKLSDFSLALFHLKFSISNDHFIPCMGVTTSNLRFVPKFYVLKHFKAVFFKIFRSPRSRVIFCTVFLATFSDIISFCLLFWKIYDLKFFCRCLDKKQCYSPDSVLSVITSCLRFLLSFYLLKTKNNYYI